MNDELSTRVEEPRQHPPTPFERTLFDAIDHWQKEAFHWQLRCFTAMGVALLCLLLAVWVVLTR